MGFVTKVDLSYNRQIKELPRTTSTLSGSTQFGIPFSAMTAGPNYSTEVIYASATTLVSTFVGTSASTTYTWADPVMGMGEGALSAITPANSATTQDTDSVYTAHTTTVIDGNTVVLTYTGISFDVFVNNMIELAPNSYSGEVTSYILDFVSAGTLDYTGRTIWSDTKGISRTEKLIVSDNPQIGYVLTCTDGEGMATWQPSSGGTGSFLWSAGTGDNVIVQSNSDTAESTGAFTIIGGWSNNSVGDFTLVAGAANSADGSLSIVGGGNNDVDSNGAIVGGTANIVKGDFGFVTGANHLLTTGATASAIIGGSGITGTTAYTVYVPNFNINYTPDTGTTEDILVRASDGTVKTIENKFSRGLYSQVMDANIISATTTETLLTNGGVGTQTVPANAFNVGDVFHLKLGGYVSSGNNELLTIRFRLDSVTGTTLTTIGAITLPTLTNQFWEVESDFVIRSLGGVGVAELVTNGQFVYIQNSGNVYNGFGFNTKNNTTFDTTKSNTLYITAEWGSSNVSNAIQTDVYYITKVY